MEDSLFIQLIADLQSIAMPSNEQNKILFQRELSRFFFSLDFDTIVRRPNQTTAVCILHVLQATQRTLTHTHINKRAIDFSCN